MAITVTLTPKWSRCEAEKPIQYELAVYNSGASTVTITSMQFIVKPHGMNTGSVGSISSNPGGLSLAVLTTATNYYPLSVVCHGPRIQGGIGVIDGYFDPSAIIACDDGGIYSATANPFHVDVPITTYPTVAQLAFTTDANPVYWFFFT